MGSQAVYFMPQVPRWVRDERFDIQARAEANPGKDDIRAMMRALLADRFGLAIHTETKEAPVFFLAPSTPGKTGPRLRAHPANSPCPAPRSADDEFPPNCGGLYAQTASAPNHLRMGARNVEMKLIAESFPTLDLGRPVIDKTGLTGRFDFTIEWAPDRRDPREPGLAGVPDPSGPDFTAALKEQLGLKLQPRNGPIEILVFDRIEHPSGN